MDAKMELSELRDRLQEEYDNLSYDIQWGTFMLGKVAKLEAELETYKIMYQEQRNSADANYKLAGELEQQLATAQDEVKEAHDETHAWAKQYADMERRAQAAELAGDALEIGIREAQDEVARLRKEIIILGGHLPECP